MINLQPTRKSDKAFHASIKLVRPTEIKEKYFFFPAMMRTLQYSTLAVGLEFVELRKCCFLTIES